MTNSPFSSIIVSTMNRSNHLERCLPSTANLDYPNYEIILVDESTSRFHLLRNQKIVKEIGARYIREKRKGVSVGHNTGIRAAEGDIIAVTDDDCIVERRWLGFLVENFSDSLVMCVAGRTKSFGSDKVSDLFEQLVSFDRGSKRREFDRSSLSGRSVTIDVLKRAFSKRFVELTPPPWGVGYGNNIAYKKTIFDKVGLFDETLGRGTKATGGDDIDVIYRILKAGYKAIYDPRAVVLHRHRETYPRLMWDVCYSNGVADYSFLSKYVKKDPYALFCYLGGITHLFLVILKHALTMKHDVRLLTTLELCGWLNLPLRAHGWK